jgi:hypothetical protein
MLGGFATRSDKHERLTLRHVHLRRRLVAETFDSIESGHFRLRSSR